MNLVSRAVLAVSVLSIPFALAAQDGSFDKTLEVTGPVRLEVQTGSGSIKVSPGASGNVQVHGEIRLGWGRKGSDRQEQIRQIEANPPIALEGSVVRVGRSAVADEDLLRDLSISYEITVPPDTAVDSKTGSGSQTIGNVAGPVDAKAGSGSLTLGAIGGSVTARTGSGSVRVESADGPLDVKTGSGSISARGVGGPIVANAGSGSIDIEQTGSGDVAIETGSGGVEVRGVKGGLRVSTGSGSIRAQGELAGDWRIEAASGSVTVELPAEAGFELAARTHSGRIESDIPVTVSGRISKKELAGTVRGGGHRLEIDTSSGTIRIR
jgi:Toastrack DUF4097